MKNNLKNDRKSIIVRTSIIGIIANIFLAGFKAIVGVVSNSIAITLDAVNNLSDALSSIITIVGTKLAGKAPDKKHPYGHGRIEYLSAMSIAIIIVYAGATSFIESVKKIIFPENPDYSMASFVIVSVAVVVKIFLGMYVKKIGEKVNSESLKDSGEDALMDSIISGSTLIAATIFVIFGISLEAWLGAVISLIIIKSGIEMLRCTLSQILGERVDKDIAKAIKSTVNKFDEVYGAYDLILSNYGPDVFLGSIHIEVSDMMTASEIDELTRRIMYEVYKEHSVILSAVGIYSLNTKDKESIKIREEVNKIVHSYKTVLQMHGFYYNKKTNMISFDIIIDYDDKNKVDTYKEIYDNVQSLYPDSKLQITMDFDVVD